VILTTRLDASPSANMKQATVTPAITKKKIVDRQCFVLVMSGVPWPSIGRSVPVRHTCLHAAARRQVDCASHKAKKHLVTFLNDRTSKAIGRRVCISDGLPEARSPTAWQGLRCGPLSLGS
jgi:hypothetical protein